MWPIKYITVAVNGQASVTHQRPPLRRSLPLPLLQQLPQCQGKRVPVDQIVFASAQKSMYLQTRNSPKTQT